MRGINGSCVLGVALSVGLSASVAAQPAAPSTGSQSTERIVVPLTDPSRPATLKAQLIHGSVTIRGGSGRDVIVNAGGVRINRGDRERSRDRVRSDGLRRLNQRSRFSVEEEGNVVTVSMLPSDHGRLVIEVPTRTNVQVSVVNGGGITIEGVDGEIEANHVNGPVTVNDVSGSVVAHSVNGDVQATILRLGTSPMAFTSLNGDIDVTVPASAKATLKMRSDHGDVLTDFDVQTTPAPARPSSNRTNAERERDDRRSARQRDRSSRDGVTRLDVDHAIYGTVNGGGVEIELRTYNGGVRLRKGK